MKGDMGFAEGMALGVMAGGVLGVISFGIFKALDCMKCRKDIVRDINAEGGCMSDLSNKELIAELKDRGMVVAVRADMEKAQSKMQMVKKFTTGETKDPHVALAAATDVIETLDKVLS